MHVAVLFPRQSAGLEGGGAGGRAALDGGGACNAC